MKPLRIPFISRFFEKRSDYSNLSEPKRWLYEALGIPFGRGIKVTPATAMRSTAVLACVRILSETVASLPLPVYKRLSPRGKTRTDHVIGDLLQRAPNPRMTAFTFRETMMAHVLLWGNCYAEIEYDETGQIVALWPIPPHRVEHMETAAGDPFFRVTTKDGQQHNVPFWAMLHVPGLGFDGTKGVSVITWAQQAIELAMATEQFGAEFFANGTNVGAVVTHPSTLSDPAFERLSKSLQEKYEGLGKSHRMMLLEEGMTFSKNTIPPNDAQFLETRKFQTLEIARIYRVPPHMLADLERATFSNIEQQGTDFIVHSVRPWLIRFEQTYNWKLFNEKERKRLFVEHLVEGYLRGDTQARSAFYKEMFNIGVYSQNDIREKENDNPIEGGDRYYAPLNMIPLDLLDKYYEDKFKPQPQPAATPTGGGDKQDEEDEGAEGTAAAGQPVGGSA
ncbi:phage portal protein [Paenibacillus sp. HN-1]|uniref:phage portal protein n=1 Tax=Paenibacillus TaxID=44249 RepID=UPI001CA8A13F|nr:MULTISPECIES: phage portal protein [Paenibacillus]MBY9077269.1 phage portal protein [Paenibacillus sp. CGMCC 1.18879]MBY9083316.1 phage portal protein [Paenibacillus sinensis]